MSVPKKRFRQFGLLALLGVVTASGVGVAIYRAITQREVLPGLRVGTSRDQVRLLFGDPKTEIESGNGLATWVYARPVNVGDDELVILFGGGDQRLIEQLRARRIRIEFQDGKVTDAAIEELDGE